MQDFRGAGKSTELRRLRRDLREQGYLVLLVDVFDYLSPSSPIDVSDFVMVLAGALSDALDEAAVFSKSATHESYWMRLNRATPRSRRRHADRDARCRASGARAATRAPRPCSE